MQADRTAARTVVSRRLRCASFYMICFVVSVFFFSVTTLKIRGCGLDEDAGLSTITVTKSTAVDYARGESDITGSDISDAAVVDDDIISEDIKFTNFIDAIIKNADIMDFDTHGTGTDSVRLIDSNITFKTIKNRIDEKEYMNISKPDKTASIDKTAVLPVDNIDMHNADCMFCVNNEVEGFSTTTAVVMSAAVDYVTNDYVTCYSKSSDYYIHHVASIDEIQVDIVDTNVFDVDIICNCRIDTYTTDADIISDTGITDTDNKLNAISAESNVYSTLFQTFILGISMCMIMIVSLNSTSFKKHHPSTKMQAVKKWFVLFLLLSGDVSGRILNTASTTNGSNINETNENNDGDSSSLTPVAPLVGNDSVSTMLTTTTDVMNKALFALNTRLLATVTVSPSNVRAANNDAVDGDIIMITPGEVDLSSGELSVGKALTFECTDPTTKCIFDAKASSSSTRRVIYDTHGKTATSRYVGLEITGGYTVR